MLESLFRAGFQIADGRPDDEALRSIMRRVHEGSYNRMTGETGAGEIAVGEVDSTPAVAAEPRSPGPRPPRYPLRPKISCSRTLSTFPH